MNTFSFLRNYQLSSKMTIQFCIPSAVNESSWCSTSSPAFGVVNVMDNRWVVVSHCFNYISLMIYDEHLFKCLFSCVSLFKSLAHFLIKWFFFNTYYWVSGVLYLILVIWVLFTIMPSPFTLWAYQGFSQTKIFISLGGLLVPVYKIITSSDTPASSLITTEAW